MAKWQYGIVADAGSSGTRIHVYRWLNSVRARQEAGEHELKALPVVKSEKSWTKKIHPGISTFGETPSLVGPDHLKELFDHALDIVPEDAVEETPLFLLATAGVRLLLDQQRKELLRQVCSYAQKNTKFLLPECDLHIRAIPGEEEGLYGWIAANYLLGGFDSPENHNHGKGHHTYGFLDMGGASAQIAFAPNATEAEQHANDLKLLRMRMVDGTTSEYKVFVTTWLGFGVHEARRRYVEALLQATDSSVKELPDPCLPLGLSITTKGDMLLPDTVAGKEPHIIGTGQFDECLSSSYTLLNKTAACVDPPCLINGVHVPAIDFDVNHFVGVSEYWHTTHEIFEMGYKDKAYDFNTYQNRVKDFCTKDWKTISDQLKEHKWGKKVDEARAAEVCFKASWLINVLHDGIGIPRVGLEDTNGSGHNGSKEILDKAKDKGFLRAFQAVDKIDDTEVSWTLGKMVLYAASQIPTIAKTNSLPVGFGSNIAGIPVDFQYAGSPHSTSSNVTHEHNPHQGGEPDTWKEVLFEGKSPRRVPGFLLFMLIAGIAVFLLCGKDRRSRVYHKIASPFTRGGRSSRRRGVLTSKSSFAGSRYTDNSAQEHLLEGGIVAPENFELGSLDGESDEYSDSSSAGKTGATSGRATPRMRSSKMDHGRSDVVSHGVGLGLSSTVNAMDSSGLFVRNESRETLQSLGSIDGKRSRRGSPIRFKSPMFSPLKEY
ncbi:Golgi apyrase [Lambiella insularis]|nr:Golgi apyrase [Lambiella insularis]